MRIRNKRVRDIFSIICTIYYLIAAEQADEKVRKVRAVLTVDHLRVAWNKPTTPYLNFFTSLLRPNFTKYKPRRLRIHRPKSSAYTEPVTAWMYFDGPLSELEKQENLVLDIPGGGFIAMDPRTSDDKLLAWAGKTGVPVLSLDYRKAPEYPYPYALNECFDVYSQIAQTKGRCVGINLPHCPRIILTGDSAGGNLATGTTLMIIQANASPTSSNTTSSARLPLPSPAALILLYPALDMNIGSWMTDDQMALIRAPGTARKHSNFVKRKSEDIDRRYTPETPRPGSDDEDPNHDFFAPRPPKRQDTDDVEAQQFAVAASKPQPLRTRLAVSSIISYFGDRIITPEMMRAMIILYVGPYNRPDFTTDHLLCPAVAPEGLLQRFPKTYFMTGERDPLVDDTVIFAGRLRQAKLALFRERQEIGLEKSHAIFNERDHVEVVLIPGISHGFIQFASIFPEGWKHISRCAGWIKDVFAAPPNAFEGPSLERRAREGSLVFKKNDTSPLSLANMNGHVGGGEMARHHQRSRTGDTEMTEEDEDAPLAMGGGLGPVTPLTVDTKEANANGTVLQGAMKGSRNRRRADSGSRSPEQSRGRGGFFSSGRSKSLVSLGSEEDLLKRRMKGLTMSLGGVGEQ